MKTCYRCGKEMERPDKVGDSLIGIEVQVHINLSPILPEDIDYYNKQLGKYSNGMGECAVAICYECYIDTLFGNLPTLYHCLEADKEAK